MKRPASTDARDTEQITPGGGRDEAFIRPEVLPCRPCLVR